MWLWRVSTRRFNNRYDNSDTVRERKIDMDESNCAAIVSRAAKAVDAMDWATWSPEADEELLFHRYFPEFPPLTSKAVAGYIAFYTWLWQQTLSSDAAEMVTERLIAIWHEDTLLFDDRPDFSRMNAVLVKQWLFGRITSLLPSEQSEVRLALRRLIPNVYPELSMLPAAG